MYTKEQEKRGLFPYDYKRYLLADLPDGRANPNTYAYSHRDLTAEEHLVADQPKPRAELIIRHFEDRFARRRARVTKRLKLAGAMEMLVELPDVDAGGKLHGDKLLVAERVAVVRPGGPIRMGDVIKRIRARDNLVPSFAARSIASATYAARRGTDWFDRLLTAVLMSRRPFRLMGADAICLAAARSAPGVRRR